MPVPKAASKLKKQTHGGTSVLVRGNNVQCGEDEQVELVRRRVELQHSIALASHATGILNAQPDPETLDLRPFSLELNDALLHELAKQMQANVKQLRKEGQVQALICSSVILSGCEGFSPVREPARLIPIGLNLTWSWLSRSECDPLSTWLAS